MKKMVEVWNARVVKSGEPVWVRADLVNSELGCFPKSSGMVLCVGSIISHGLDSDWASILKVNYEDPVTRTTRSVVFSEDECSYHDCFYVER